MSASRRDSGEQPQLQPAEIAAEEDDSPTDMNMDMGMSPEDEIDINEVINMEWVYAMHTFVASLEGQVCVYHGDSCVLLDDTNSYWWLVKSVKTNEIGYIPAENIETARERLARQNRRRNVMVTMTTAADVLGYKPPTPSGEIRRTVTINDEPQVVYTVTEYQAYHLGLGEYDDGQEHFSDDENENNDVENVDEDDSGSVEDAESGEYVNENEPTTNVNDPESEILNRITSIYSMTDGGQNLMNSEPPVFPPREDSTRGKARRDAENGAEKSSGNLTSKARESIRVRFCRRNRSRPLY